MKNNKRIMCVLLSSVAIFASACGESESSSSNIKDSTQTTVSESEGEQGGKSFDTSTNSETMLDEIEAVGDIEVDKDLFSVKLTIPAEFAGETTQEELDAAVKEKGYKSATLNEDGSIKYVMTKKQHAEMMKEIEESLEESLEKMIGSEEYPNFTDIKCSDDYTKFEVITKSSELDISESMSVLGFYMYGGMYNIFNGTTAENVHVDFINADSGEIISSSDSKDQ